MTDMTRVLLDDYDDYTIEIGPPEDFNIEPEGPPVNIRPDICIEIFACMGLLTGLVGMVIGTCNLADLC